MDYSYLTDLWGRIPAKKLLLAVLIILAFVLGYCLPKSSDTKVACVDSKHEPQKISTAADAHDHSSAGSSKKAEKVKWWTCSMHPQIKLPHPGKCPICFMDLIPVTSDQDTDTRSACTVYDVRSSQEVGRS